MSDLEGSVNRVPVFFPYRNSPAHLMEVLRHVPRTDLIEPIVINNSGASLARPAFSPYLRILEPPVPLTFVQSQNWMLAEAKRREAPFYLWGHCDAVLQPDTVARLYDLALDLTLSGERWGVIYTYYDIFCAYSTAAAEAVGGYDPLWSDYCSDQDFYRRLDLAGYARVESHLPVAHDHGSTTIRTDPRESLRVGLQVAYRSEVYIAKWGGPPGSERYDVPFNRPDIFGEREPTQ